MKFRRRDSSQRQSGLHVPLDDVPAHLACGWRLADDFCDPPRDDERVLLRPPECFLSWGRE